MKKPCPDKTKAAGAQLLKARRAQEKARDETLKAHKMAEDAIPDLISIGGAKAMQFGEGLNHLLDAAKGYGHVMQAHNSFRAILGCCGIEEPTDEDLVVILGPGGGGR